MTTKPSDAPPRDEWLLIRRARQLITLHGPSGPRRGNAMNEIGVVGDGAVLVHNGVIVESGASRRIENLRQARAAREIDAAGKVVMPAFVDPDGVLVSPAGSRAADREKEMALRVVSRKRLESGASAAAAALARAGVLTVGAHTGRASDLRETTRALVIHQGLQNKPLRIRSILSPRQSPDVQEFIEKWIVVGRKRKLASILELTSTAGGDMRQTAMAGASAGYSLRIRSTSPPDRDTQRLALEGGAVAMVAPPSHDTEYAGKLAAVGCVQVLAACDALRGAGDFARATRLSIDAGAAVALASGYGNLGYASFNPQFLLHLGSTHFGMTAEEAICASTWNAACSLRMSHVTGSLEPGKSADLLVMDVPDYRELARRAGHNDTQLAIRAGRLVYRRAALTAIDA